MRSAHLRLCVVFVAAICLLLLSTGCQFFTCPTIPCPEGQSCTNGVCQSGSTCEPPKVLCGSTCVNVETNATHCGSCDKACPTGQLCGGGACRCAKDTEVLCEGTCVDTKTNPTHCGACKSSCVRGQTCVEGACVCERGLTSCAGRCIDAQASNDHCGACDTPCAQGESCQRGSCVLTSCPSNQRACAGTCVDPLTDTDHCGTCGNKCPKGSPCQAGKCGCAPNFTECAGKCVSLRSDEANCGRCGRTCGQAQRCREGRCACEDDKSICNGLCIDTKTDPRNCGSCGKGCRPSELCVEGTCQCPQGQTSCGGTCVDLSTNAKHCSRCSNECLPGTICQRGICACPGKASLCKDRCVDLQTDGNNCGTCGNVCPARTRCDQSRCVCKTSGESLCGTTCVNLQTSNSHCGSCRQACPTGAQCTNGKCTCTGNSCPCPSGKTKCGTVCVDLMATFTHCGACGNKCDNGETCSNGQCICPTGRAKCGNNCVDVQSNNQNCGACGNQCQPFSSCKSGKCECFGSTTLCDGQCVTLASNQSHCGACNNKCPTTFSFCNNGICECAGSRKLCNNTCVDTQTDNANCGTCGNACQTGFACIKGQCRPKALRIDVLDVKAIQRDSQDNLYITGRFEKTAIFGSHTLTTSNTFNHLFVAKLSNKGQWLWAKRAYGLGNMSSRGIAVDPQGNAYLTGVFINKATMGSLTLSAPPYWTTFVAKLDPNGQWLWVKASQGSLHYSNDIAAAQDGAYVIGTFERKVTLGTTTLTTQSNYDIYVAKIDANGQWKWARGGGGQQGMSHGIEGITQDNQNNLYVAGFFNAKRIFGTTTLTGVSGKASSFVAKISPNGQWQWAMSPTSTTGGNYAYDIARDTQGNIYVAGRFTGNVAFGTTTLTSGLAKLYVSKLNNTRQWVWANQQGDDQGPFGRLAVAGSDLYHVGYFQTKATFGSTTLTSMGGSDVFVSNIDTSSGQWQWTKQVGSNSSDRALDVTVDSQSNPFVVGHFSKTAIFGTTTLTAPTSKTSGFLWLP